MANDCYTHIEITGTPTRRIGEELVKAMTENTKYKNWLGNLLLHTGWSEYDIDKHDVRCRGSIVWADYDEKTNKLIIDTDTAWVPMIHVFYAFCDTYCPETESVSLRYWGEEPNCDVFWTNDESYEDMWNVDVQDADAAPDPFNDWDLHEDMSEACLVEMLAQALGHSGKVDALIKEFNDKYEWCVGFHKWDVLGYEETLVCC